jgi:hypothetical protein
MVLQPQIGFFLLLLLLLQNLLLVMLALQAPTARN